MPAPEPSWGRVALWVVGLWLVAAPCAAQKTDVVQLKNGDRLTCEIKALQFGYLEVDTDSLGSLSVIWMDVAGVSSTKHFVVEVASGRRYLGSLQSPRPGRVQVGGSSADLLDIAAVVSIRSDRQILSERLDGSVELQFNLARANRQRQWSLAAEAGYSGLHWFHALSADSTFTSQQGAENTSRNDASLQTGRFLSNRWFYAGLAGAQQNDELGLRWRVTAGGGLGRRLFYSNRRALQVLNGLLVTREQFEDVAGAQTSLEAFTLWRFDGYRRRSPKLDATVVFELLPSLTDPGRIRGELNVSTSIEVVHNLFVGVSGFDSFDSRPPDATLPRNDYGVTPSLRWKF